MPPHGILRGRDVSLSATTREPSFEGLQVPPSRSNGLTRLLLLCGIGAVAVYFLADVLASALYGGYSYTDQTISELSAVGTPTRSLWLSFSVVFNLLWLGCAAGIWRASDGKRRLRVIAVCVAILGGLGLLVWPFAPIHQRELAVSGETYFSDTLHAFLIFVNSILFLIATGAGLIAFGGRFRLYTIVTIVVVLMVGGVAVQESTRIELGEPTPGLGISERTAVYGSLLWPAIVSLNLRRSQPDRRPPTPSS